MKCIWFLSIKLTLTKNKQSCLVIWKDNIKTQLCRMNRNVTAIRIFVDE